MVTYYMIPSILHFEMTKLYKQKNKQELEQLKSGWEKKKRVDENGKDVDMAIKGEYEECLC